MAGADRRAGRSHGHPWLHTRRVTEGRELDRIPNLIDCTALEMVVGVFSVRRREDLDQSTYATLNDRMWDIVSSRRDFGLIGITGYRSDDGRSLAMAFFKTREGMLGWKSEVEHAAAQQRGREEFFLDYWGFAAEMVDAYEFDRAGGRRDIPLDTSWRPAGFEGPGE